MRQQTFADGTFELHGKTGWKASALASQAG